MFLVMVLKTSIGVTVMGHTEEVPFTSAGMVGMCPVFATREEAEAFSDGRTQVWEIRGEQ